MSASRQKCSGCSFGSVDFSTRAVSLLTRQNVIYDIRHKFTNARAMLVCIQLLLLLTLNVNQAITFPKILVCSNSMHSRYKLEVFYSQLNATMIEKFYGNYDEINGFKKQEILNLIKLNVSAV